MCLQQFYVQQEDLQDKVIRKVFKILSQCGTELIKVEVL